MKKKLLLLGGGHAHLETLIALEKIQKRGHDVTVVSPSPYHYYSGMGPGMLSGRYTPEEIRFDIECMVTKKGGRFIQGRAVAIDPAAKTVRLESGKRLVYDVLSVNVGSWVDAGLTVNPDTRVYPVKPIEELMELRKAVLSSCQREVLHIAVVGGGPSSVEVAGNMMQLVTDAGGPTPVITIYARNSLCHHFNESIKIRIRELLEKKNIRLSENDAVTEVHKDAVRLASGRECRADLVVSATGVRPSTLSADSNLPTGPDGGLRVNRYLQSIAHPDIFGGGDCIYFEKHPLGKVGVYAVRQNKTLLHNILAQLEGTVLDAFDPGGDYLLIFNLGDGRGYLHKSGFAFDGRLAFQIKHFIDSRFMRKYQRHQ